MKNTINTICFLGESGSGKTKAAELMGDLYSYTRVNISSEVRKLAQEKGYVNPTREDLQLLANAARAENGNDYFARRANEAHLDGSHVIFEGIRHPDELAYLKEARGGKFVVCGLVVDRETRFKRVLERGRASDPVEYAQFVKNDERELGVAATASSQNTLELLRVSDHIIYNTGDLFALTDGLRVLVDRFELNIHQEGSHQQQETYNHFLYFGKER